MKKTRREDYEHRTKVMNKKPRSHESQPRMERIMHSVAEWISFEMKELQSACMLVSRKARGKEYEEFLSYQDGQVWKEMSEEFAKIPDGKRREPCLVIKRCVQQSS